MPFAILLLVNVHLVRVEMCFPSVTARLLGDKVLKSGRGERRFFIQRERLDGLGAGQGSSAKGGTCTRYGTCTPHKEPMGH